jgi:hypothetical protein
MYFSAIGFIYDVKRGPFWEHSPMLYDISGIQAGWAKINKVYSSCSPNCVAAFPMTHNHPGHDQDVQRRSTLQVPSSAALPLRIVVQLGA